MHDAAVPTIAEVWGQRIKECREARSLTQTQLADQLGVEQTTVSRWERGNAAPGPERQVAIAELLERSWAELFSPTAEEVA